jgi:hypothetical protein
MVRLTIKVKGDVDRLSGNKRELMTVNTRVDDDEGRGVQEGTYEFEVFGRSLFGVTRRPRDPPIASAGFTAATLRVEIGSPQSIQVPPVLGLNSN